MVNRSMNSPDIIEKSTIGSLPLRCPISCPSTLNISSSSRSTNKTGCNHYKTPTGTGTGCCCIGNHGVGDHYFWNWYIRFFSSCLYNIIYINNLDKPAFWSTFKTIILKYSLPKFTCRFLTNSEGSVIDFLFHLYYNFFPKLIPELFEFIYWELIF